MDQAMTIQDMEEQFPSEWLLILDPKVDQDDELSGGHVAFHSKDRDEVYRRAVELQPQDFAFHFTGTIPDDAAVVL